MPRGGENEDGARARREILAHGLVQGVGFRPFVRRLAERHRLAGTVRNEPAGVRIVVEGSPPDLEAFLAGLAHEAPPLAVITALEVTELPPAGETEFRILPSGGGDAIAALVPPDVAVCDACLAEMRDPLDRRSRYPFLNCTDCGPRFTLIEAMPYDRPATTMREFTMCAECAAEYADVASRRYHAQPNACPRCGPRLRLRGADGRRIATGDPVGETIRRLAAGEIGAIKGVGGYHLACDATSEAAVRLLRARKRRPDKPLAVMAGDLAAAERLARLTAAERSWLTSWRRPIVLCHPRRPGDPPGLAPSVGGTSGLIGLMLPYAPLHHLLFDGGPGLLVMTSGNRSDEPIACDNEEAVRRLRGIADFFLEHDRRIHQRADDPVVRVIRGAPALLRRSRGFVPEPVPLARAGPPVLALGGDLKNVFCVTRGNLAFCGPYIGDLSHPDAHALLSESIGRLLELLGVRPEVVAHDLHPDYHSTRLAEELAARWTVPRVGVQHHRAHLLSVLAEHGWDRPALGLALDGVGFGDDGTAWGGELLLAGGGGEGRLAALSPLPLPGGDRAAVEPWRMGLAVLARIGGPDALQRDPALLDLPSVTAVDARTRQAVWRLAVAPGAAPLTTSAGRLFDAAASLLGLRQAMTYEGQAAAELEACATSDEPAAVDDSAAGERALAGDRPGVPNDPGAGTPLRVPRAGDADPAAMMAGAGRERASLPERVADGARIIETLPLLERLLDDALAVRAGRLSCPAAARRFHRGLATLCREAIRTARAETAISAVALSGGVMQNRRFTEELAAGLEADGFTVLTHRLVPPNDGGIALGQAWHVITGSSPAARIAGGPAAEA